LSKFIINHSSSKIMADILHHIKAKLYPNELTEDPDDYTARVSAERSIDISGVCRSATGRGGASGKPDDMEQHVRTAFQCACLSGRNLLFGRGDAIQRRRAHA
jgi:hypothetical protein